MQFIKKLIVLAMITTFSSTLLTACTTQYHKGDGIIVAEKRIQGNDYKPHDAAQSGAKMGGTLGVVGGATAGGIVGITLATITLASTSATVAMTLGGAALGALAVGTAGAVVGGGVGYAVDASTPGAGIYQFIVKPDNGQKNIAITQYSAPIPLHAKVHILEKGNEIFVKRD